MNDQDRGHSRVTIEAVHRLTGHNGSIFCVGALEADRYFFSAGGDGWVARWDLDDPETGRLIAKVETQLFTTHFIASTNHLVLGNMNGGIHWVNLDQPDETRNIAHHQLGVFDLIEVGDHIFSAGGEGMLSRWDKFQGRSLESLYLSNQSLRCLDHCRERKEIAVGSSDHAIYLLDAESLAVKNKIPHAHENSVFSVRYHPDGKHLLSGGRDAHLRIWSLENYEAVQAMPAHWYTLNDIAFSPKGDLFATASRDKTIKIWDARSFELLKVLETVRDQGHINSVNNLFWSPYQHLLISASDDRTVIVWRVER